MGDIFSKTIVLFSMSIFGIVVTLCACIVLSSENVTLTQLKDHRGKLRTNFGNEVHLGEWPHHILIFRLYDKRKLIYRAFCAGSIIGETRILSGSNCFLTNHKNHRHNYNEVRFVAGVLKTVEIEPNVDIDSQWRSMKRLYSQRFYRFPAYSLAVAIMNKPWVFNQYVNKIPYATRDYDFDGMCTATAVKATRSWSTVKHVHIEEVEMLQRAECERILCRSCRLFMCTNYEAGIKYAYAITEGGGLICYDTGDPAEEDNGVLVAVTTIVNVGLPNLHMRVGLFNKWVKDSGCNMAINKFVMVICVIVCIKTILM